MSLDGIHAVDRFHTSRRRISASLTAYKYRINHGILLDVQMKSLSSLHFSYYLTLCILMDGSIQIKAKQMGLSIIHFKGSQVGIFNYDVFLFLRIVFTLNKQ